MALPNHIAAKIKSIPMDPSALANNMELAYMLSFSPYGLSSDIEHCNPKDAYHSPLQDYSYVDFEDSTYEALYAETCRNYEGKNSTAVRSIRNSFKDFYTRVAAMTYSTVLRKNEGLLGKDSSSIKVPNFEAEYKIDQMKGHNPLDWPRNLREFHEEIGKLPWNAFASDPEIYFFEFYSHAFVALRNQIKLLSHKQANRTEIIKNVQLIIEVILMMSLKTNNQTLVLTQLESLNSLKLSQLLSEKQQAELVSKLQQICTGIFQKIPVTEEQEYHMPKKLWANSSAFMIMKKIHFQRQNGLGFYSVTNDGTYLYIYVSSMNGGMYKVGTGRNSSVPGKIYLQREMLLPVNSKLDEVNWVYLNNRLYLKSSAREPNCIEVINPDTFKTQHTIQLRCNTLYGHQALINLNRNSILLTDGLKLYVLGRQIKITKNVKEQKDKKEEQSKTPKEQQDPKNKKKRPKKQKNQQQTPENPVQPQQPNSQQIDKIMQFVLYQFDLEKQQTHDEGDEVLANQLHISFNGYFTLKQCKKALDLCQNDISEAAQWLVDQGEKERTTKIFYPASSTIICESDFTFANNILQKNIKQSKQVVTKQGSLLHTQNVNQSIWTMDEDEITCYSEVGFKIFSKCKADFHPINQNSHLSTTHLKTVDYKFLRNPEYNISYDPYNKLFYTFTWPSDGGHYFPTAVLIGSDSKQAAELTFEKKVSLSQFEPRTVSQLGRWLLLQMNLIDNLHCPDQGRINNWCWYYAQKIVDINKEMNASNDLDKKKLSKRRAKYLAKMNDVNDFYKVFEADKRQLKHNKKITKQILFVPPFGPDGSIDNLKKIRSLFSAVLEPQQVYSLIIGLQGWLEYSPRIFSPQLKQQLNRIRDQLLNVRNKVNKSTYNRLTRFLIQYFHQLFDSTPAQQSFIMSLSKDQIYLFVEKHHITAHQAKKSLIYELQSKVQFVEKYDAKSNFQQIFPTTPNITSKPSKVSVGRLLIAQAAVEQGRNKAGFIKFLEKSIAAGRSGVQYFEYVFLEAFRIVVQNRAYQDYKQELEVLFLDAFRIIRNVLSESNTQLIRTLCDCVNQIVQLYFASMCSFHPSLEIIELLLQILDGLQKKQCVQLFSEIEDMQLQGISQTYQKIYQTPHPIERGRNQNFLPLKNTQASLIYAQFDKRCQSDPNHDILSIQITHEGMPVGNSINCNDGVFTTYLRLTGKVDSGKPYLIMGNSVNIDFSSSGHAKDAKSFGRFGFKFGLRPIFAGKLKYKRDNKDKIQKIFDSKSEFEKYINTLKLLAIAVSNSIQNLTHLQKLQQKNKQAQKFLNGKIFKQGYEEELVLPKSVALDFYDPLSQLEIENQGKNKGATDERKTILRTLHSSIVTAEKSEVVVVDSNSKELKQAPELWDIEGIPAYIRTYAEKIKAFDGDFIDVFLEARKLAMPKGIYANQLRKSSFGEDMKRLWLQGQAILFLTVLKHSGLLHLNLKFSIEYIKANLKAFEEARNGIFEAFIRRMQTVRQWRDLLQTYQAKPEPEEEKKQENKKEEQQEEQKNAKPTHIQVKRKGNIAKIKFNNPKPATTKPIKKQADKVDPKQQKKQQQEAALRELKQAERKKQAQKQIRQRLTQDYMIKGICQTKNIEYAPQQTYDNVTRILARLEQESKQQKKEQKSVYIEPIEHLIKSCLFLLKLKSSSAKQVSNEQELVPEQIYRSYSQDPRHANTNKVKVFREWLENWKKWKDFKKQGKVELKFPVSQIIQFVNSWIPLQKFKQQIQLRVRIANNRTKFYELNNALLKRTSNTLLSKYVLGNEVANLKANHNAGLQSVPSSKIEQLDKKYSDYVASLKSEQARKFKELPLRLQQIQTILKNESESILQKIKLTALHLYLIESDNPEVDLDVGLFFIPFKYLNTNNQELIFISSLIVQRAFVSRHSLHDITSAIEKQVGSDSISCKRWRDYFFIERVLFLLRKLENKCRQKLVVEDKRKVASVLFYLIYHLEIPLVCRVCLKILNLLKIQFSSNIDTPFSKTYKAISLEQNGAKITEFKPEISSDYTNPEIIAAKCYEIFNDEPIKNQIKQKLLAPFKAYLTQEEPGKPDSYCILLNMNQEEDVAWMVTALYYLEEVEQNFVYIKDWEEYLNKKNKRKQHREKEKQNKDNNKEKKQENKEAKQAATAENNAEKKPRKVLDQRLLIHVPNELSGLSEEVQSMLPVGWFFNYCNVYSEFITKTSNSSAIPVTNLNVQAPPNLNQKKGKANNQNNQNNPNNPRKQWNPVQFAKLQKKFEDLTVKPIEEPKEEQSEQIKTEFIKAKNFIARMRKHCSEVANIYNNLSQTGFYIFRQDVPREKCELICQLFSLGGEYRLKPIPCDYKFKDMAGKLSPVFAYPAKKSELKITCIQVEQLKKFNQMINYPSSLQNKVENNPLIYYTALGINEFTLEDKCHLPYEQFPQVDSNEEDQTIQFSKYFMESNISRMKKKQDEVFLKEYPKLRYFVAQGGLESGLEQCTLVPTFDASVTGQKAKFDHIYAAAPRQEILEDTEEIVEKTIKLMKGRFTEISKKQHIIPYMLISCYLEKISKIDLTFLDSKLSKQFAQQLYRFVSGFKADNSTEVYRQKIQVLITKMLDGENKNLKKFRLFRYEEDRVHEQLYKFIDHDRMRSSIKQQKNQATIETLQTHQFPKSNYLLPVHTPIPEQNKLLKYWQKNILPKIHQFVKSSLKQLQIDDFFEQMRIPLRKNDQLEAKKVAYVICDNKLPQGAVLPDASHNWNSLTIEQVTIGQDVLIKLPKSKYESSSPLLCSHSEQYRVGQIMFIDQKNFSVLVRHRLPQYALFVYSWVPINVLEAVEKSLTHYSLSTIYKQLQESFKGIIYNYSKTCITTLSSKININMDDLIQQTIVDLVRDNPISAWNEQREWSLKPALKKLLKEGNTSIIDLIQQKFCPVQSYDIDLFTDNMQKLNKFENVLGLIVSFRKTSSLIWYSGIRFYSDEYGFKEIANIYASKSCVNELNPIQFGNPNVYCRYYSNKQFLKAYQQNKYDQKQIMATIFGVDRMWSISTFLSSVVGEVALEQKKYEAILTRINKVFLAWLQKRQIIYLSTELCRVITKNTLKIRKLLLDKGTTITLQHMGTSETQIKSLLDWINQLVTEEEKTMLVLYSPLVQNLIEMVASLLSSMDKVSMPISTNVQQVIKIIQMMTEIEYNLNGKKVKRGNVGNEAQWERILVIENIPEYISDKELRDGFKAIVLRNNGKILSPSFDIFYRNGTAIILVDSWDITELVEEEIIQKIENQEEKQPEQAEEQGLMMQWACSFCVTANPPANTHCLMCDTPAPVKQAEIVYEKVETKDVNQTEMKLREKEMSRFEKVKGEIKDFIGERWEHECRRVDKQRESEQKNKQEKRKKKSKVDQVQLKPIQKPSKPTVTLCSGSSVLDKTIVEEFLKHRFDSLPQVIRNRVSPNNQTYLGKFKQLSSLGFDLWGDNISSQAPCLLNLQHLSHLMHYVQDQICKGSSSVLSYNESSIRLINQIPLINQNSEEPINFSAENNVGVKVKYNILAQQKSYNIRYSWRIIKELNLSAYKCLSLINMDLCENEVASKICTTNCLGANLKSLRHLIMGALKLELFQKVMQKTSVLLEPQDIPKINLERLKIKEDSAKNRTLITIKDKDDYLFTKAHQQLEKVSSINLRPFKPKGTEPFLSFIVNFKGQLVQGQAGPYRQFFTDMSNQLHPEQNLGLFIKTPNNIHKTGESRSKWTINPKANSTYYLSLFHFLGRLMGCCIRTGCHLPIDLADFCWKLIADEPVKRSDIQEMDKQFFQQNQQLMDCPSEQTFDSMEEVVGQPITWTYTTVDGEQQQLIPNGRKQRVSYGKRIEYVKMMERRRIEEISLQVRKIRDGLYEMIPQSFMNHISGEQLKTMACGVPKVDVQLLRKHTKYAGGLNQQTPVIKYFWQFMREISQAQRLKLIRFCWGQERLPLNSEQFQRNGIRFMIKPMLNKQNPDQALPKADTCFFNIELPQYSSKQILRERILLAVNLDNTSINGDRGMLPDDNPLMGNVEYEDEGDEEGGGG